MLQKGIPYIGGISVNDVDDLNYVSKTLQISEVRTKELYFAGMPSRTNWRANLAEVSCCRNLQVKEKALA